MAKRIALPITTNQLCSYGCNQPAKFTNGSNKLMCAERSSSCPAVKEKNSKGLHKAYETGKKNVDHLEGKRGWRKGKVFAEFGYGDQSKGGIKSALIIERGHKCEVCEFASWNGIPITLELEHSDGDRKNNNKDNLKLLCPNCHSQTPTWRRRKDTGKVNSNSRYTEEEIINCITQSKNLNQVLDKLDLRYGSAGNIIKIMSKYGVGFKD